ncbi:hypothetical protein FB451DRAFT_1409926 [Mycena latifolia]|nr:hypothetical protein FB451DRAFT_1409926 [Mycena latifolia]
MATLKISLNKRMACVSFVPLFHNPRAVRAWMVQTEDTIMGDVYDDSTGFIEDRNCGSYHDRRKKSRWSGSLPRPTFVFGINAPLDGPIPPFGGFVEVDGYSGDGTRQRADQAHHNNRSVRYCDCTPSVSGSTSDYQQDDRCHYEGDTYHEEVLRHRAIVSRERYIDEPDANMSEWLHYNKRLRHDEREEQVFDRARFYAYSMEAEDRLRACETARARYQATPIAHKRAAPLPVRTRDSPDLRDMPRGPDGHPQSAWAVLQSGPEPPEDDIVCSPADPEYVGLEELRIS